MFKNDYELLLYITYISIWALVLGRLDFTPLSIAYVYYFTNPIG